MRIWDSTWSLVAVAALSRAPFWWHGFGVHPDEWGVIRSGLDFWLHGSYFIARPPGYPFNEIMMGGLAWIGGAPLCAAASTAAAAVTLVYFRRLTRLHGTAGSVWLTLALAFHPWFWATGTCALDFAWSFCCQVVAFYYVERGRLCRGGVWCGLGIGFRPTSMLWCFALLVRVLTRDRSWRDTARFLGPMIAVSFLPVMMCIMKPEHWAFAASFAKGTRGVVPTARTLALGTYRLVEFFGHVPAATVLAAGCWLQRKPIVGLFRNREPWLWPHCIVFVVTLYQFYGAPAKGEYLLPVLPGVLLIVGRFLSTGWWKVVAAAFFVNAFVSIDMGSWREGSEARVQLPSLRRGSLLWHQERITEYNVEITRLGEELTQPNRVVALNERYSELQPAYVSSLLPRGPAGQARVHGRLTPAMIRVDGGDVTDIEPWHGFLPPPLHTYGSLLFCDGGSILIEYSAPVPQDVLLPRVREFCESGACR